MAQMEQLDSISFEDGRTIIEVGSVKSDFCEEIQITEVLVDLEKTTRQIHVIVKDSDGFDGDWYGDASKLRGNPIKLLTDYGLHLADNENNRAYMADILSEVEKKAPKSFVHESLGWYVRNGERCYLGAEAIGASFKSKFHKPQKLASRGSFDDWKAGVKKLIEDAPELHLAIAISASAAVFPLLKEERLMDGSIVIALLGGSSKSKTTISKFMMTAYADPTISQGNVHTLSATDNFICGTLSRRNGWLMVYDESSVRTDDLTSLLYQLGLGEDKGRCSPSGDPRESKYWHTTCVITGERNIITEQTNGNAGIKARVVPMDLLWTASPELSEQVAEFCGQCYGTAYIPLAEYLMQIPTETLVGDFKRYFNKLCEVIAPKDGVERRLVKTYSVLLLSAKIASEAWNLPLDGRAVKDLLLKIHEANLPVRHPADKLYESIKSQILDKSNGIRDEKAAYDSSTNAFAIKTKHKGNPVLWVKCSSMDAMIRSSGESNIDKALDQLYAAGYLIKAYGRRRSLKDFKGIEIYCYCLALLASKDYSEPQIEKASEPEKRKVRKCPVHYGGSCSNKKPFTRRKSILEEDIEEKDEDITIEENSTYEETAPSEEVKTYAGEADIDEYYKGTIEETAPGEKVKTNLGAVGKEENIEETSTDKTGQTPAEEE